ncbi:Regulatory protein BlaR1 [Symmachiella macrocystis]|uniref:Regulatory protein BlaR1 n=1 Tax=Symmachiella macrocystis TaxID=2527985 RepID=A0A5C6BIV2_9PLAN|nr:M56 family metallopeptidase [Symmachiella macrocystis]TWU12093.1 Regulatory protein BlaR1 [Symmachiella macrocystis]
MPEPFQHLLTLLDNALAVRWLITLLNFLWQGAAIGGLIVIAGTHLRGASARLRYASYSTALLSLPVCVVFTFFVVDVPASWQSRSHIVSPANTPAMSSPSLQPVPASSPSVQLETTEATGASLLSNRVVSNSETIKVVADDKTAANNDSILSLWPSPPMLSRAAEWFVVAYVVGVVCFLLRLCTALWAGRRLRIGTTNITDPKLLELIADQADRVRLKCVPVVAYCERVAVPTVVGVLRPMVLLPMSLMTGLSPDDFAAIIRHELAHIRRYDLWMNLLQRIIESLLFFHPIVWFISRRLSAEREVCCDELVVSSGCEPLHYAGALLRVAELCVVSRQSDVTVLAATGDSKTLLERRIKRLMNWGDTPRLQLTRGGMVGLLMTLVSLIVVPGIAHTWAQAQAPASDAVPDGQSQPIDAVDTVKGDKASPDSDGNKLARTPRNAKLRKPSLAEQVSPTHPPSWARRWEVTPKSLFGGTAPLVLDDRRLLIGDELIDIRNGTLLGRFSLGGDKFVRSFERLSASHKFLLVRGSTLAPGTFVIPADEIQVWDIKNAKQIGKPFIVNRFAAKSDVGPADISPDGKIVAVGNSEGIRLWNVATGKMLKTALIEARGLDALAFSPDGRWLVISDGNDLTYWEWQTDREPRKIHVGRRIISLAFSPDSQYLAEGPDSRVDIQIRDMQSLKVARSLRDEAGSPLLISAMSFSSDGKTLIAGNSVMVDETRLTIPHRLHAWSVETGKLLHQAAIPHYRPMRLCITPDGSSVAVALDGDGAIVAVWPLTGTAGDIGKAAEPVDEKAAQNTHYRGKKAAELIDKLKPAWGDARLGIQYGVALTKPRRQFRAGERVPMAVFIRNVSNKPLQIDVSPDFLWNVPKVVDEKGNAVEIKRIAAFGGIARFRETLKPGETFGLLSLGVGLGDNPRAKQNWHPYYKAAEAGKYKLTHTLSIDVTGLEEGDQAKREQLISSKIEFEILPTKDTEPIISSNSSNDADNLLSKVDINSLRKKFQRLSGTWIPTTKSRKLLDSSFVKQGNEADLRFEIDEVFGNSMRSTKKFMEDFIEWARKTESDPKLTPIITGNIGPPGPAWSSRTPPAYFMILRRANGRFVMFLGPVVGGRTGINLSLEARQADDKLTIEWIIDEGAGLSPIPIETERAQIVYTRVKERENDPKKENERDVQNRINNENGNSTTVVTIGGGVVAEAESEDTFVSWIHRGSVRMGGIEPIVRLQIRKDGTAIVSKDHRQRESRVKLNPQELAAVLKRLVDDCDVAAIQGPWFNGKPNLWTGSQDRVFIRSGRRTIRLTCEYGWPSAKDRTDANILKFTKLLNVLRETQSLILAGGHEAVEKLLPIANQGLKQHFPTIRPLTTDNFSWGENFLAGYRRVTFWREKTVNNEREKVRVEVIVPDGGEPRLGNMFVNDQRIRPKKQTTNQAVPEDVIYRGLKLSELPATGDPHSLVELYQENPAGSGVYEEHLDTCFMPMPGGTIAIYYRPEAELFFVRREAGDSYSWYGPVAGNPLEKLELEPLLLESMRGFGTAGNARITLVRMARSSNAQLAATGLRLMRQVLTDEATLESIDERARPFHQADLNLDSVIEFLNKSGGDLRKNRIDGLTKLEAAVKAMASRFTKAMPVMSDEQYNEAGYLQQGLPRNDSIQWGRKRDGMQLGISMSEPVVLTPASEPHRTKLYLRNVSDHTVRFHLAGHPAEQVRVEVTDPNGKRIRTEFGDIPTSIPGFPTSWRLEPGEKIELCQIRLAWALPDANVKTTDVRGMRMSTTRLRAVPGRYHATLTTPINSRRVVRGKGEWSGSLTSKTFPVHILSDDSKRNTNGDAAKQGLDQSKTQIGDDSASQLNTLGNQTEAVAKATTAAGHPLSAVWLSTSPTLTF